MNRPVWSALAAVSLVILRDAASAAAELRAIGTLGQGRPC